MFGPLFDFNGDGKVTPDEEFLGFMIMQECLKSDQDSQKRGADHSFLRNTRYTPKPAMTESTDTKSLYEDLNDDSEEDDGSWREEYYDNPVDIDPDNYGTLEEFLWVYEPVLESMYDIFTEMVRNQLSELKGQYDIRLAAAIVYLGSKDRITETQANYVMERLTEEVAEYGYCRADILLAIEQLKAALEENVE